MAARAHLGGKRGVELLHDPLLNKGTAFDEAERGALGLRGLLPARVATQAEQVERVLENVRRKTTDLEKYIYMVSLAERNEQLFYRVLVDNLEELMPVVYTPTVGQACQRYAHIFSRPRGVFLSIRDRGRVRECLQNWPSRDVRVIVVTDGERILGLGDLGANGMGIPVGKLALYTACAGIHPEHCLPVMLDTGTDNDALRSDPIYFGLHERRIRGEPYDALVEEFIVASSELYPGVLIQLEDFGNANAFRLLQRYRDRVCLFDDDIQGTAAVAVAGLFSALRVTGRALVDQRVLFLGAGEAGIGIGELLVDALVAEGVTREAARRACWYVDSRGLVARARDDLAPHKRPFAHDHPRVEGLLDAVRALRPTALVGVSGIPGAFTDDVLGAMAALNERPIVFALSNPTANAECTAEAAYRGTDGRAVFASGSPFGPVERSGRRFVPGQGNNAYIFPGVGLGVLAAGARRVTDAMFLVAARTLAGLVTDGDLALGRVYPPLSRVRDVSAAIAEAVAGLAFEAGLARKARPEDLQGHIRRSMFDPSYVAYV